MLRAERGGTRGEGGGKSSGMSNGASKSSSVHYGRYHLRSCPFLTLVTSIVMHYERTSRSTKVPLLTPLTPLSLTFPSGRAKNRRWYPLVNFAPSRAGREVEAEDVATAGIVGI